MNGIDSASKMAVLLKNDHIEAVFEEKNENG
jgi:hypothetical protein